MKYLRRFSIIVFILIAVLHYSNQVVHASAIGEIEEFNKLDGDAKYLGNDYIDNYSLDIEKTDIFDTGDKMMNNIANGFFSFFKVFANLVCSIFYFAMKFDITDLLGNQINGIQKAMNNSIFSPLFTLACVGIAFSMIKRLLKQDVVGIMSEIVKVIGLVVFSILIVNHSDTVLSNTTKITKEISTDVLTEMNSQMKVSGKNTSYAAESAGVLWVNLIHEPWKSLEFGTAPDRETVDKFLNTKEGSAERKDLVKEYEKDNEGTFKKSKGMSRFGLLLAYLFPFLIKCCVYIAVAVIQLVFQLMALFFVLMAPLVLILAMVPGYEGMIGGWLKKVLETQIGILIITFMMALMIKIDISLYNLVPQIGWYVGIFLQIGLSIGLFLGRNKILHVFTNIQRSAGNPRYLQMQMKHMGNPYKAIENMQRRISISQNTAGKSKSKHIEKSVAEKPDKPEYASPEHKKSSSGVKQHPRPRSYERNNIPDYVATPTQYNQRDTSDLHAIWENAVPKEELNQDKEKPRQNSTDRKESYHRAARPTTSGALHRNSSKPNISHNDPPKGSSMVERPRTYSTRATKENAADRKDSVIKTNSDTQRAKENHVKSISVTGSDEKLVVIPKSNKKEKRPKTSEVTRVNNSEKPKTTSIEQHSKKSSGREYPAEAVDRPILLNGKPIERPTTQDNRDLKKNSKKKFKEKISKNKSKEKTSKVPKNRKGKK